MLINCNECGREISDTAKQCPHCGSKVKRKKSKTSQRIFWSNVSKIQQKVFDSQKGRVSFLCSLIAGCAIVVCFLIVLIIAYCAPLLYLNSKDCIDGYHVLRNFSYSRPYRLELDNSEIYAYGGRSSSTNYIFTHINLDSSEVQLQYDFDNDGKVSVCVFFLGYECDFTVKGTTREFTKAYKSYSPTTLTSAQLELANNCVNIAELFYDTALKKYYQSYSFDKILSDYSDFQDSLKDIRVSSMVLMSVFAVVSVSGIVFFSIGKKKKLLSEVSQGETVQEDLTFNSKTEQYHDSTLNNAEMSKPIAEFLKMYKELLDGGVITQEEFERKKKEILK